MERADVKADDVKNMSGSSLDDTGVALKLDRVTKTRGHSFDEPDDSYRRRLLAELVGAAVADAMSQPAVIDGQVQEHPTEGDPSLRQDGPTIAEWISHGYQASMYPPKGYAARSSKEEIDAAIVDQQKADEAKASAEKSAAVRMAAEQVEADRAMAEKAAADQATGPNKNAKVSKSAASEDDKPVTEAKAADGPVQDAKQT